ncbi:MAG: class I SAM-dependent methyltransferase [Gammaproteobacteria bacterium]|nr:class I SAM-dependent methyltransferase [Gammaproteobacteria bacterium]
MDNDYSLAQALANAAAFSVIDKARLELIARSASRQLDTAGDFIELGVFRGGSAILLASIIKHHRAPRTLHLLDSWQGLPELEGEDLGTFVTEGQFSQSSEGAVRARLDGFQLLDVCKTYQGWVEHTLPELSGPFSLVHLDLDLYRPTHFALSQLLPKMKDEGEIIIDDYGNDELRRFPGVEKAVSEILADSDWSIVESAGERDQSVRIIRQS